MNIIVIVSDTFRQDHLGCYGNAEVRTPHLDRLAARSVQFERCYCTSFPTMPARADLYTGRYTFTYLGWNILPRSEVILPALLRDAGYETLAAVDTPFFPRTGYGYDRGFTDFRFIAGQHGGREGRRVKYERRYESDYFAPKTITAAEELLEFHYKGPFYLHVDMWDPHEPWDPPAWYVTPHYPGYDGRIVHPVYGDYREHGVSEEDLRIAHACYCGEIAMVDQWVGRLLDKIEAMGLWDETIIVFVSDHGFFFGEHGFFGKGRVKRGEDIQAKYGGQVWIQSPLYQELIRVPLLMAVPGVAPKKVKALVSWVDLMPTLLELADVEIPDTVQGRSMMPLLRSGKDTFRDLVVSSFPLYMTGDASRIVDDELRTVEDPHFSTITTPEWSFLYSTEDYPAQLYNLEADPAEAHNVITDHWAVAETLHGEFVDLLEKVDTSEKYLAARRSLKPHE